MWFNDGPLVVKRRKPNRRKRTDTQPLLMVSARVADQRRERSRRIAAVTLSVAALAGLCWVLVVGVRFLSRDLFTGNPKYLILNLDLQSDGQLRDHHVREYAGLREGMNLFSVDLNQVRRALQDVPVVRSVEVTRRLPDTLSVRLTERLALARLGADDRRNYLAIDRDGHVLGPSSRRKALPAITGLRDRGLRPGSYLDEKLIRDALDVLDLCDTTRVGQTIRISSIDVRHPEHLDITLVGGERVLFGRSQLEWRLSKVEQSLQAAARLGKAIKILDWTVDKNAPVEWM
jgi:cell division protein FtsQ